MLNAQIKPNYIAIIDFYAHFLKKTNIVREFALSCKSSIKGLNNFLDTYLKWMFSDLLDNSKNFANLNFLI